MQSELVKLLKEYRAYVEKEDKRIQEDQKDPRAGMSFSFDGFYNWLLEKQQEGES